MVHYRRVRVGGVIRPKTRLTVVESRPTTKVELGQEKAFEELSEATYQGDRPEIRSVRWFIDVLRD